MAKDPAFLFYSSDFLTGTMFFSDEQTGKYIRLLCAQHQKGHLTEKDMLNICKTHDEDIFSKFIKDDEGRYYNQRCEIEINKRKKYSESRANNRKSVNSDDKNTKIYKKDMIIISNSYEKHMENENENRNENIIKNENELKKFNFKNSLKNYGFDEKLINDWLIVRKNKKASNTETAFNKFISEVEKIEKVPINEILTVCVERSWSGFKAEWFNNINSQINGRTGINQQKQHPLTELRAAANQILSEYAGQNSRTGD